MAMMNKIQKLLLPNKRDVALLAVITLSLCLLFYPEYSTDSYVIAANGVKEYSSVAFNSGRAISALFFFIVGVICNSFYFLYYVSFLLALACATLSIKLLAGTLDGIGLKHTYVLSGLIVLNPLCLEYFLFAEKGMFFLGILFIVIAFKCFCAFKRERLYALPICALFIGMAAFIYQPLCALFVPLVLLYICVAKNGCRKIVKHTLVAALTYGIGLLFNVFFLAVFTENSRMKSFNPSSVGETFFFAGWWQSLLIYIGAFALLFLIVAFFGYKVGHTFKSKEVISLWLKCSFISVGTICAVFLQFLFVASEEIWFPFRVIYPLGALIGVFVLLIKWEFFPFGRFKKHTGIAAICLFFILEIIFLQVMLVGRIINNSTDHSLCREIGEEISAYENRTGSKITKISIYHDKSITHRNPFVTKLGDSNVRAFSKSWSDINSINAVLGTNYEKVPRNQYYEEYFSALDWTEFSKDQLIFDGDTLHLCVY